jgi:periplasmic divalent cation tolerance protein
MDKSERAAMVYTTFPSAQDARKAGRALVEARLAACVNIFPVMTAIFEWEGKIEEADEAAMIIKTRRSLVERVMEEVKNLHPYVTPALLVIGVEGGSAPYISWLVSQTITPD